MKNIRRSATMKYLLVLSMLLVFVQVIEGDTRKSAELVFQETNNVKIDYDREKYGTSFASSADGIEITWTWKPLKGQENKVKFGPILGLFRNVDNGSGLDGNETENGDEGDYEIDWSFSEHIDNVKKDRGNPKTHDSVERKYLDHERNLEKSNWCFKENKDAHRNNKYKKTDVCCRKRKQCRKARLAVRRGIYQCSCDVDFYRCLAKSGTAMSKSIGKLYFNKHNVVCYMKLPAKSSAQLPFHYKRKIMYHFPT